MLDLPTALSSKAVEGGSISCRDQERMPGWKWQDLEQMDGDGVVNVKKMADRIVNGVEVVNQVNCIHMPVQIGCDDTGLKALDADRVVKYLVHSLHLKESQGKRLKNGNGNGKWQMANCKLQIASCELRIGTTNRTRADKGVDGGNTEQKSPPVLRQKGLGLVFERDQRSVKKEKMEGRKERKMNF